jgi:hypothetical protein
LTNVGTAGIAVPGDGTAAYAGPGYSSTVHVQPADLSGPVVVGGR